MTYLPKEMLWRKRINRDPKLSLECLAQLRAEDSFGFGVTLEMWADRVLAVRLDQMIPVYHVR